MPTVYLGNTAPTNWQQPEFEGMTKEELRASADEYGLDVPADALKDDLLAALRGSAAGGKSRVTVDNGHEHDYTTTIFAVPTGIPLMEAAITITRVYEERQSDDPPEWVESDSEALALLLADHWTTEDHECTVGRPANWEGLVPDAALEPDTADTPEHDA